MSEEEITVEQMDDEDEEHMDQAHTAHHATGSPSLVVVDNSDTGESDTEPTESPVAQSHFVPPTFDTSRMLANRLHLHQTLSDSSTLKAKLQRQKHGLHRLSPIPKRHELHNSVGRTNSVGAVVPDGSPSQSLWKRAGESPRASTSLDMSDDSAHKATPILFQPVPPSASVPRLPMAQFPGLTPLLQSASWLTAQGLIPSQEQLEAMHKNQLELLSILEHQKQATPQATPQTIPQAPADMFPFVWPLSQSTLLQMAAQTKTTPIAPPITSGSTPAESSTTMATMATTGTPEPITLTPHLPLRGSYSAPGVQSLSSTVGGGPLDHQYELLLRQFQLQHQSILVQQQQLYQQYLEQQQRMMQQAIMERKHFEEQQRKLASLHLQQQQQLQKQQQFLRKMQEQQLHQFQRQLVVAQTISMQQQRQQAPKGIPHQHVAPGHAAGEGHDHILLPYASKMAANSSASMALDTPTAAQGQSPAHTPKVLTPTSSHEGNGRSSPSVGSPSASEGGQSSQSDGGGGGGTGLVYDAMMLKHYCSCGGTHPEHPGRLQSIWARLHETRVVQTCKRLRARKAQLGELQAVHSENHTRLYGRPSQKKPGTEKKNGQDSSRAFLQLSCGGVGVDQDTYWNDTHTCNAARMAAGCVIELAEKVAMGEVRNGFAFVRPPGHHALPNQAMAFCYFNNVALAAKALVAKNKRVLIVDWDIHHGSGTQQIFYDNPNVLFISIHRYDNGTFFPGTGRPEEVGSGAGLGFNINIAFSGSQTFQGIAASNFGDPEYLAAFRSIVVPVSHQFNADVTLVSAGFNATDGHPPTLGGYSVTPACYAYLTRMLMNAGNGKVAMALEGGYELMSLCASSEACMRALMGEQLPPLERSSLQKQPQPAAIASMEKTIASHKVYWPVLTHTMQLLRVSHSEAEKSDGDEVATVHALASLSVDNRRATSGTIV